VFVCKSSSFPHYVICTLFFHSTSTSVNTIFTNNLLLIRKIVWYILCAFVNCNKHIDRMLESTSDVPAKGGKLCNTTMHNLICAHLKTEYFVYRWLWGLAMFDLTYFLALSEHCKKCAEIGSPGKHMISQFFLFY